jgi:hypothetical protein
MILHVDDILALIVEFLPDPIKLNDYLMHIIKIFERIKTLFDDAINVGYIKIAN